MGGGPPGESKQGEMGPKEQRLGALGVFSLWYALGWLNAGTSFGGGLEGIQLGVPALTPGNSLVISKVAPTLRICEGNPPSCFGTNVGRTGGLKCTLRGGQSLPWGSLQKGGGKTPGYAWHPQVLNLRIEAIPWIGRGQGSRWPTSWHTSL